MLLCSVQLRYVQYNNKRRYVILNPIKRHPHWVLAIRNVCTMADEVVYPFKN
jgi:hypothetical protein